MLSWTLPTTLVILGLSVASALPTHGQPLSRPPIDDLVRNLQTKYESVRDFSADFEHRYSGGVLRTSIVEYGTVLIKKPGKMRWRYTSSEEKLYVSDGEIFYSFFPVDQQVIIAEVPPDDQGSTPALFLAGKGSLADDFKAAYANEPETPDSWVVRLTPETSEADYELLTLTVDRESLADHWTVDRGRAGRAFELSIHQPRRESGRPRLLLRLRDPRERPRHQARRSDSVVLSHPAALLTRTPQAIRVFAPNRCSRARPFPVDQRD